VVLCPDVVPFIDRCFDCRDLLQRSLIHYGSRTAPRISGAIGVDRNDTLNREKYASIASS